MKTPCYLIKTWPPALETKAKLFISAVTLDIWDIWLILELAFSGHFRSLHFSATNCSHVLFRRHLKVKSCHYFKFWMFKPAFQGWILVVFCILSRKNQEQWVKSHPDIWISLFESLHFKRRGHSTGRDTLIRLRGARSHICAHLNVCKSDLCSWKTCIVGCTHTLSYVNHNLLLHELRQLHVNNDEAMASSALKQTRFMLLNKLNVLKQMLSK